MQLTWSLIVLAVVPLLALADREAISSGLTVKVLGHSGKIKLARGTKATAADDVKKRGVFVIEFDELKELDSSGNEVGKGGQIKHSINTFAPQNFTFSPLTDTTLQNVSAKMFTFESTLKGLTSTIKVYVYIIKEDGQLNIAGDTIDVKRGQMKFSIELSNWEWCPSNCSPNAAGAFVDFTIALKCPGKIKKRERKNRRIKDSLDEFDLGDDSELRMAAKMERRNNGSQPVAFVSMPTGYPKQTNKGAKKLFTFRFTKFSSGESMLYDPMLSLGLPGSGVERIAVYPALILIGALLAFWTKL